MKRIRLYRICLTLFLFLVSLGLAGCLSAPRAVDYGDAEAFEQALNQGKNMEGTTVLFQVKDVFPQSTYGYNIWAGEHLNFVSERNPDVKPGEKVAVKVTDVTNSMGSWILHYERMEGGGIGSSTIVSKEETKPDAKKETETSSQEKTEEGPSDLAHDLDVVDYGYVVREQGDGAQVDYFITLNNPNDQWLARKVMAEITIRDEEGEILCMDSALGEAINPGDTVTLVGTTTLNSSQSRQVSQVMISSEASAMVPADSLEHPSSDQLVISDIKGQGTKAVSGVLTSHFSEPLEVVHINLVIKNKGRILEVRSLELQDVQPDEAVPFSFDDLEPQQEYDEFLITAAGH